MPGGRGLSGDGAVPLWLAGWGPSCQTGAICLGFPSSSLLALWLENPEGWTWEEPLDTNQSPFPFNVTSPRAGAIQ